mgnify:CR=1 FL=1
MRRLQGTKRTENAWRCNPPGPTPPERPVRVKRSHIGSFANVSRTAARAEERFCGLNSKREGHTKSAFIWPISITRLSATMYTARVRHRQCAAGGAPGGAAGRGRNDLGFAGQALHAERLRLIHPRTHEQMEFFAPLPEHFKAALEKLRGANG